MPLAFACKCKSYLCRSRCPFQADRMAQLGTIYGCTATSVHYLQGREKGREKKGGKKYNNNGDTYLHGRVQAFFPLAAFLHFNFFANEMCLCYVEHHSSRFQCVLEFGRVEGTCTHLHASHHRWPACRQAIHSIVRIMPLCRFVCVCGTIVPIQNTIVAFWVAIALGTRPIWTQHNVRELLKMPNSTHVSYIVSVTLLRSVFSCMGLLPTVK